MPLRKQTLYELGCHLVTGLHQVVLESQAAGEKYTTGTQSRKQTTKQPRTSTLNIFQANVRGLRLKDLELAKLFRDNQIHVALI